MADRLWPLADAQRIAGQVRSDLLPFCDRCEIAGSIRRRKPQVRDIEIVCIPKQRLSGLFEFEKEVHPDFVACVARWPKVKGTARGRYTQRLLPEGIALDLFMVTPETFGLQFAIRTGSADFSHRVLAKGWVAAGYRSEGGVLMKGDQPSFVREERDLFALLGIAWVEPEERK